MEAFGSIEAVKAVNDLFCPVGGEILEVNADLDAEPVLVNSDPYGDGWIIKIRVSSPDELTQLMDSTAYASLLGE
jgi:glycine cleavage system H protein